MEFTGERFIPDKTADRELAIEHTQRYHSLAGIVKGKNVLDAACGEGYGAHFLSKSAKYVYGIDISEEAISHAKNTYIRDNLSFLHGSVSAIPIPGHSIDFVVSYETIEHLDEETQHAFLLEITRLLHPDGVLIISTPNKKEYTDKINQNNEFHIKEFYQNEFREFLKRYFKFVVFYYQNFETISLISNETTKQLSVLETPGQKSELEGKYIIAICSAQKTKLSLGSAMVYPSRYDQIIERILALQEEVATKNLHIQKQTSDIELRDSLIQVRGDRIEELSHWGKSLDEELNKMRSHNAVQAEKIKELSVWGQGLGEELTRSKELLNDRELIIADLKQRTETIQAETEFLNSQLLEKNQALADLQKLNSALSQEIENFRISLDDLQKKLTSYQCEILTHDEEASAISAQAETLVIDLEEKDVIINNQKEHIKQLLEQERILQNIYKSSGWRLLLRYYRVRDKMFPENRKRTLIIKMIYRTIKNPGLIRRHINLSNIKKFINYLKTEDGRTLKNRIESYFNKYNNEPKQELKVYTEFNPVEKLIFPETDNPVVSIVIPVYNQWNYTYSCLHALLENIKGIDYEVIIADDVSNDETAYIRNFVGNVQVIRQEQNLGFLRNCNSAAQSARGRYIVFLNNDTNVQVGWLESLVELAESDPSIGMVGSKLIYADGTLQEAGGIIWADASGWNYGRYDDPEKAEYNYVKEVDYISGASIMIRAELWHQIGGFDEQYAPAYFEDADLAFEMRKRGFKLVYQPKSVVVHFEGKSHGTDTEHGIKRYQTENRIKFVEKWRPRLEQEHFENGKNVFWARDKSRNRKTILVIDHYVPHFDKDAGSRTTFQYLKLFVEMGFNVKFLGDNFYRHEPYTGLLQRMGIEVLYGVWYRDNYKKWIKEHAEKLDFVYLNRPHIAEKYIDFLKQETQAKIIYYGHDLHYLREQREYEIIAIPELLKSSKEWKKRELALIEKVDIAYYPSQVELDEIRKELPLARARAIPAYIFSGEKTESGFEFNQRQDLVFVGGFAHRPNIDGILWFLDRIFPAVLSEMPEMKLYVIGSNPPDNVKEYSSKNVIVTGYISDPELDEYYRKTRMAVVPLRYGAGIKGKVVEALYHRMPVVTTSIGAEGLEDIEKYLSICDNEQKFAETVITLYRDTSLLNRMSRDARTYVMKYYSRESALNAISEDFKR